MGLAGLVAAAACGGDGGAARNATEADLAEMVLQPEDVPAGFQRTDEDGKIELAGEAGIQANLSAFLMTTDEAALSFPSRFAEFELPAGEAAAGDAICVLSVAAALDSREDAELALFNSVELTSEAFSEIPEVEVEQVDAREIGYAGVPFRLRSPREDLCSAYKDQPAEGYVIYLINRTVYGAVFVWTAERGADLEEAIALGEKQFDRMKPR